MMAQSFSKSLWILAALTSVSFLLALVLPKNPPMQDSRLQKDLSDEYGQWSGRTVNVGERERAVLAADTDFLRKEYSIPGERYIAPISLSVVFSGRDVNNSIHRPEVCLRTQGWNFLDEKTVELTDVLPNGEILSLRRIIMEQQDAKLVEVPNLDENGKQKLDKEGEPVLKHKRELLFNAKDEPVMIRRIQYYTFLGADSITSSHWSRVGIDILDRLRYGYDQAWAYTTIAAEITDVRFSSAGYPDLGKDQEQTEQMLQDFINLVLPNIINAPQH